MKSLVKYIVTCGLLTAIGITPLTAQAESNFDAAAPFSAVARLNLRVTIPEFLYFRVGSAGGAIDTVTFTPAPANVGDSSVVNGDSTAAVTVRANAGLVSIAETNNGSGNGLNGFGTNISLSQITASSSDSANLETPFLSDGGGNSEDVQLNSGSVTNRTATWSYTYANTTVPEADDYDVVITYTATTL